MTITAHQTAKARDAEAHEPSQQSRDAFIIELAKRYCWDMDPAEAIQRQDRVLLRVLDIGDLDDSMKLEATFSARHLTDLLGRATEGALRPRSLSFWALRLNLDYEALVDAMAARSARRRGL